MHSRKVCLYVLAEQAKTWDVIRTRTICCHFKWQHIIYSRRLRVRFFCENPKGICDLRSFGSCRIKAETDESTLDKDSSVSLIRHDPSDLTSQIRFRILPKKRTISLFCKCCRGFNNFTGERATFTDFVTTLNLLQLKMGLNRLVALNALTIRRVPYRVLQSRHPGENFSSIP